MSDTPEKKEPTKPKGSPHQPKRQYYHTDKWNESIKPMTEAYKRFAGKTRLSPEERDMLAYFTIRYEVGQENSG